MLPDIRAVVAAIFAAIGLLAISFGLAATFRVAQESRTGSLQADLAQRSRMFIPASSEQRTVLLVDTPTPLEPIPVTAVEVRQAPEIPPVEVAAVLQAEPTPPPEPTVQPPAAEPPVGGPLEIVAARSEESVDRVTEHAIEKEKAKKAAAKKARVARERIARQRKAAARRAAQLRARQQAGSSNNASGNSVGGFGADLMAEPPHHAAFAPLSQSWQHQRELVRHVGALGMQPHAAIGNVGDPAIARQRAGAGLDLGEPTHRVALVLPPVFRRRSGFEFQHDRNSAASSPIAPSHHAPV
jgi:hypothetical protein